MSLSSHRRAFASGSLLSAAVSGFLRRCRDMVQNEESGQGMVEFVIVFPIQFIFVAGIIQFSLYNMAVCVVNHASYRACRSALTADLLNNSDPTREAHETAVFVLSGIAGTSERSSGAPISYFGASGRQDNGDTQDPVGKPASGIGRVTLARSPAARAKTPLNEFRVDFVDGACRVVVTHYYELTIPVVRRLTVGRNDWIYREDNKGTVFPLANDYQVPHTRIVSSTTMSVPWKWEN